MEAIERPQERFKRAQATDVAKPAKERREGPIGSAGARLSPVRALSQSTSAQPRAGAQLVKVWK